MHFGGNQMRKLNTKISLLFVVSLLFVQFVGANCHPAPILNSVKLRQQDIDKRYARNVIRDDIEVCVYFIKNGTGNQYTYVLMKDGKVTYCGVASKTFTTDPVRRAMSHSNPSGKNKYFKDFDKMIAIGPYQDRKIVLNKEKECVCKYGPKDNRRPTCKRRTG